MLDVPPEGPFHERYRDARTASFFGLVNWDRLFNKINLDLANRVFVYRCRRFMVGVREIAHPQRWDMRIEKSDN